MANTMTPEEIQLAFEQYELELRTLGAATQATTDAYKDAKIGVKDYTRNLRDSMAQLGQSFKALGKDVYDGAQGAAVYNEAMSAGGTALAAYAARFGPAGVALGLFTKAAIGYANAVSKQSDALYENYQKISRSGVIGQKAMTEVYDQMGKFGYTVKELGNMGAILAENSKNLALFGKSAVAGAEQFGEVANNINNGPYQVQLRNLGLTVDDVNKGIAGYLVQEGKLGTLRGKTTDQLTKASNDYIKEMEVLTRLTGQTREDMESQREQALQIDAFYAGLKDLAPAAKEEALKAFNIASSISPKMAAEFAANFNGAITGTTDLLISTGGKSLQYSKEFFARGGTADQAVDGIAKAVSPEMMKATDQVAKIGGVIGLTSRELTMLTNKGLDPVAEAMKDITSQVDKAANGYDAATDAQSKTRKAQVNASQNLADLINIGIVPVTKAMQYLADTIEWFTDLLPGSSAARKRREAADKTPSSATTVVPLTKEQETAQVKTETAANELDLADKKLMAQMDATDSLRKSLETISKAGDKSAEATAKIAELKKKIAESEEKELVLNKEAQLAQSKKLEAANAQNNINRKARANDKTPTAEPVAMGNEGRRTSESSPPPPLKDGHLETPAAIAEAMKKRTSERAPGNSVDVRGSDYISKMIKAESGGKNIANNSGQGGKPTSTAFGIAQFTKGTFEGLAQKAGPTNPLYGKRWEEFKADVGLQLEATKQLTDQNRLSLENSKVSTSDSALYLAHFLGAGGAVKVLKAPDNTPIEQVVSQEQIAANPNLQKMAIVSDLKQWASSKMGGAGYQFGGISEGPKSGYQVTLHGTEAVVPLPDGRSIPVTNTNSTTESNMTAQLDRLDEIISVMKNQLSVSTKIMQYQT